MAYPLSATKLQTYGRCAQQFYYRYERRVPAPSSFGSAALGTALHRTLRKVHGDWHYNDPFIPWPWVETCWGEFCQDLSLEQRSEGLKILGLYTKTHLAEPMHRPLALEGRIDAELLFHHVPFKVSGRYDRIEYLDGGKLHLIDYKSAKDPAPVEGLDLQIGLYYLALEQRYHAALARMSLLFLRTGELVSYEATLEHRQQVLELISDLAQRLHNEDWTATTGKHCDRCGYRKYCPAATTEPVPLPLQDEVPRRPKFPVQLAFA
uniref:PD-(D/E)XK endonuclease-like domain-containing protein n=1 Tax=Cyanothece sp. (strain PCC 7425 / ATCC 29141) TaxID=395961 RepID=B8HJK3_CYAP4